ncbi:diguanylate cyclase, partial [Mesorhizobium sp. M7A.F.Ca.CA.001.08.2.1]
IQTYALAYQTGSAWNETGFADPDFDAKVHKANSIADPEQRRVVMKELQVMLQDSGIIVQPYWRKLFCHMKPALMGYQMHQAYEQDFTRAWLAA